MICLDIMIFWQVTDSETACKNALEILNQQDTKMHANQQLAIQQANSSIALLRQTVLRIVKNHLCSLVSTCSLNSKVSKEKASQNPDYYEQDVGNTFEILGVLQQRDSKLKQEINLDLVRIGCTLSNVCIYSVTPQADI